MQTSVFKIEYIDIFKSDKWDEFISRSSLGTLFQSSPYVKSVREAFNRPVETICVIHGGEILGGVILYSGKHFGLSYVPRPYFIPYNGFILSDFPDVSYYYRKISLQNSVLTLLRDELEKRYLYCSLQQTQELTDLRNLLWHGWHITPEYTVIIPLQGNRDLFSRVDRYQRRRIRTLETEDLTFSEEIIPQEFFTLMEKSYHSHRLQPPLSGDKWIRFVKLLQNNDLARTFGLKIGDKLVTALLTVEGEPKVYGLFSGREVGSEYSGMEIYLIWKVMEYYRSKNFENFDLLGAMVPSIAKTKLELGGILKRSDSLLYYKNKMIRSLVSMEMWFRRRKRDINI